MLRLSWTKTIRNLWLLENHVRCARLSISSLARTPNTFLWHLRVFLGGRWKVFWVSLFCGIWWLLMTFFGSMEGFVGWYLCLWIAEFGFYFSFGFLAMGLYTIIVFTDCTWLEWQNEWGEIPQMINLLGLGQPGSKNDLYLNRYGMVGELRLLAKICSCAIPPTIAEHLGSNEIKSWKVSCLFLPGPPSQLHVEARNSTWSFPS